MERGRKIERVSGRSSMNKDIFLGDKCSGVSVIAGEESQREEGGEWKM